MQLKGTTTLDHQYRKTTMFMIICQTINDNLINKLWNGLSLIHQSVLFKVTPFPPAFPQTWLSKDKKGEKIMSYQLYGESDLSHNKNWHDKKSAGFPDNISG